MGVLTPGSAHARPFVQSPFDMSKNLLAHVSDHIYCHFRQFKALYEQNKQKLKNAAQNDYFGC
jgi:hypothetical protein